LLSEARGHGAKLNCSLGCDTAVATNGLLNAGISAQFRKNRTITWKI
jgi:hypothetical protein